MKENLRLKKELEEAKKGKSLFKKKRRHSLQKITDIYHKYHGVTGYRTMRVYLSREGFPYSCTTVHKYMNRMLGLKSIVRPRRPAHKHGEAHNVFENSSDRISTRTELTRSGAPILHTGIFQMEKCGTTARF